MRWTLTPTYWVPYAGLEDVAVLSAARALGLEDGDEPAFSRALATNARLRRILATRARDAAAGILGAVMLPGRIDTRRPWGDPVRRWEALVGGPAAGPPDGGAELDDARRMLDSEVLQAFVGRPRHHARQALELLLLGGFAAGLVFDETVEMALEDYGRIPRGTMPLELVDARAFTRCLWNWTTSLSTRPGEGMQAQRRYAERHLDPARCGILEGRTSLLDVVVDLGAAGGELLVEAITSTAHGSLRILDQAQQQARDSDDVFANNRMKHYASLASATTSQCRLAHQVAPRGQGEAYGLSQFIQERLGSGDIDPGVLTASGMMPGRTPADLLAENADGRPRPAGDGPPGDPGTAADTGDTGAP